MLANIRLVNPCWKFVQIILEILGFCSGSSRKMVVREMAIILSAFPTCGGGGGVSPPLAGFRRRDAAATTFVRPLFRSLRKMVVLEMAMILSAFQLVVVAASRRRRWVFGGETPPLRPLFRPLLASTCVVSAGASTSRWLRNADRVP